MFSKVFSPVSLALWLVITAVAAVTGPFGTYQKLDLPERALYWAVLVGVAIVLGRTIRHAIDLVLCERPAWLSEALTVSLIVPAMTVAVIAISPQMPGMVHAPVPSAGTVAGYVLTIACIVILFRRSVHIEPRREDECEEAPRLAERLPEAMRGKILRLTGQDHHVEVVTTRGTTTLRIRLTDAMREMEPVEGYCTHRSHWVTRGAIDHVERESSAKLWIVLINGDRVPVSRKYRPELE
ncbi:LytTR family DNA-binding domain-containing protein [Marimonas lutisalis]|uniref:LytTR family DNA-binding domain-containing protein n=1 Tax=Marimonas lutisalis TaxID=2545756 RepID=UPI0010F75827|nr:LytTR family DNA-binding domain-containing protein [Marimonas lutisalis]